MPLLPVPVFAPGASTGRIPATLATALRRTATDLHRRLTHRFPGAAAPHATPPWRQWAEMARGYLALVLALLPRPRPAHTFTVFVAAADTVSARPAGPAPYRRSTGWWEPGPDAAP
ncbi:hypothetical protein [Streptomyces sp. NPDC048392]|uniref:hypothetical protein n=1 Tax=Streptomyces sp. NPDC048392 TaxID=3365543 RepID=UPI003712DAD0